MSLPSVPFAWSLIIIIIILAIHSLGIIVGIITHSRKIRASKSKFQQLFNSLNDALIVFDKTEKILMLNDYACQLLGYSKKELGRLSLKDIVLENNLPELREGIGAILKNSNNYSGESNLVDKNEIPFCVEVILNKLSLGGKPCILGSFRDITKRKRQQDEIEKKNIALREVLTHLEEEKRKIKEQIAHSIDQTLIPAMNKLLRNDSTVNLGYYNLLKNNLKDLANSAGGKPHVFLRLSPREIEICNFVRNNATSKEIANALNISIETVNKHRDRIRKKLGISNKNINLTTFLSDNGERYLST